MEQQGLLWNGPHFSPDVMQCIVRNGYPEMDGRTLARMRVVCSRWRRLVDGLPTPYLVNLREHTIRLDSVRELEEELLSIHLGKAHVFHQLNEMDALRVFVHIFNTRLNANPFLIYPAFKSPNDFLARIGVLKRFAFASHFSYLTDNKSGDFWLLMKWDSPEYAPNKVLLQNMDSVFQGVIQWKFFVVPDPVEWIENRIFGIPLQKFVATTQIFCLHVSMRIENHFMDHDFTKMKTASRCRKDGKVRQVGRPALNSDESWLLKRSAMAGLTIREHRSAKRAHVNDDDDDDDNDSY